MFRPNQMGQVRSKVSRDVHGRIQWGDLRPCPFGVVNLEIGALKTTVRADSSASRGSADETVSERASILIPANISVELGDGFRFEDVDFQIVQIHRRRSVLGHIDHQEISLEIMP